jgi:hypothetical protein
MAVQEHAFASGIINDAGIEAYDGVCRCRPSQPKPRFVFTLELANKCYRSSKQYVTADDRQDTVVTIFTFGPKLKCPVCRYGIAPPPLAYNHVTFSRMISLPRICRKADPIMATLAAALAARPDAKFLQFDYSTAAQLFERVCAHQQPAGILVAALVYYPKGRSLPYPKKNTRNRALVGIY